MRKSKIFVVLVLRTLGWSIGFSFLLAVVTIIIPNYAIAISFVLGAFFMERETRKRLKQYVYPLVSSFLLSALTAFLTYEFTSGICTLTLMWSISSKYCVKELYGDLVVIEGMMLMAPWLFILFMFIWYRVIFRKRHFPE